MYTIKKYAHFGVLLGIPFVISSFVFAQNIPPGGGLPDPTELQGICRGSVSQCLVDIGFIIMRILLTVVLIFAAIFFIYGGILYVFSGGDDTTKRKQATNYLIYGIIAIVVAFLAFSAVALIRRFTETLGPGAR